MSQINIRVAALAASAMIAMALPSDAMARGGGNGGGGGAHFGGGCGGFRGFSGGGMRMAPSIAHAPAFSARSFSGVRMHSGMPRSFSGMTYRGNRSFAVTRNNSHIAGLHG